MMLPKEVIDKINGYVCDLYLLDHKKMYIEVVQSLLDKLAYEVEVEKNSTCWGRECKEVHILYGYNCGFGRMSVTDFCSICGNILRTVNNPPNGGYKHW